MLKAQDGIIGCAAAARRTNGTEHGGAAMRAVYWSLGAVAAAVVAAVVALPIVANGDAVRQRLSDAAREGHGGAP